MALVSPLLICIYASLIAHTTTQLADISELCPYSTFCTKGPLKTPINSTNTIPCCLPCSCEDDCYLFGNCCPDKPDTVLDEEVMFPCRYQHEIYNGYLRRNVGSQATVNLKIQYLVVDQCPPDAITNPSLQEAVLRCHRATDMEDLVFVSDVITDRVYLNRHCAECNGVQTYTEWSLQVTCEGLFQNDFSELDEMRSFIFEYCSILSLPPKQIATASMCIKDSINTCQLDSSWNLQYYEHMERNCAAYNRSMPYIHGPVYFANIFCFLCSTPPGTKYSEKCSTIENVPSYRDIFFPISSLIRFRGWDNSVDDQTTLEDTANCPENAFFDPITIECTKLLCPKGTIPSYGSCETIVGDVSGFGVEVRLGIRLPATTNFQDDPQTFLDGVVTVFMKHLRSRKIVCGLAHAYISLQTNDDALAQITLYSKATCHYIDLLHALAEIVKQGNIVLKVDGSPVTLSTYLVDLEENGIIGDNVLAFTEQLELWYFVIFTKETVHCPSIEFSLLDLDSSTYHDNVIKAIMERADEIDNSRFRICTKYLNISLASDKNASTGQKKSISALSILLVVLALSPP